MKPRSLLLTLTITIVTTTHAQQKGAFTGKYVNTKTITQSDEYFGTKVTDPYRWLENDMSAETAEWVKAQNEVSDNYFSKVPYRDAIRKRLTTIWNYEKFSMPFKAGAYLYYYKNDGLQNQSVLYRQRGNEEPEVFLDPNKFSTDGTVALAGIDFSKDGSLVAYTISESGSDWNKMIVINTATKQIIDDSVEVKFSALSFKGNEGVFYSRYDKLGEGSKLSAITDHHKLYFHKFGTSPKEDLLIFGDSATKRRYVMGGVSEDQHWLEISASNATYGNELYLLDLTQPNAPIIPLVTGFEIEASLLYSDKDKLYIVTNWNAPNRKIMVTNSATPGREHWKELIPEQKFPLTVTMACGKIFAHYTKDAITQMLVYNLNGVQEREVVLPGPGSATVNWTKKEEKETYYLYSSYVNPATVYKYDIATGQSTIYKKPTVPFDLDAFESKQVFYTSKDGTKIPMIITHKKGLKLNGKNPTLLYGYGGFNVSLLPSFSISNIVFMENGGVYAVANLRGGGEYGDVWHKAGTKLKKQNVFDDFIAAAEYLIHQKITSKDFLAIAGGSNGGLLVGACMTQRPDLFRVCFPAVGVLDMLRYHKFTAGAGWSYDYGTADESKEMFDYLLQYSPVHNVKKGTCYPATLVTTADHDDRVVPAHSFKFAASLQAAQGCDKPVLIKIQTKAGHGAGKPLSKTIEEHADKWSFLFWNMGLDYKW